MAVGGVPGARIVRRVLRLSCPAPTATLTRKHPDPRQERLMRFLAVRWGLLVTLALPCCAPDVRADEPAKPAGAAVWDRFRGPNGTGTSDDKDVPLTFGA